MTTNNLKKTKLADLKQMLKEAKGEQKLQIKAEIANKELIEFRKKQKAQTKALAAAEKAEREARETAQMKALFPQYETLMIACMSFAVDVEKHKDTVGYFIVREVMKNAKSKEDCVAVLRTLQMKNYAFMFPEFGKHLL